MKIGLKKNWKDDAIIALLIILFIIALPVTAVACWLKYDNAAWLLLLVPSALLILVG